MSGSDIKGNIGLQDVQIYKGEASRTFNRRTSSGALVTLHKFGNTVDALQAVGDGLTPTFADLNNAISAIGGRERTLELSAGTWPVTDDLTIPATITVLMRRGSVFSVSAGKTLTLSGPVIAEEQTWYTGSGTTESYEVSAPGMIKMLAADDTTTVLHGMGNV